MKEYIKLYLKPNSYLPLDKNWNNNSLSQLYSLLFGDFRPWDDRFLTHTVNCYNANFIYHDIEKKIIYVGFGDWLIDEEKDGPSWDDFPNYVNETNSCRMSVDNYLEFRSDWVTLKKELPPFAIIYRDENDWVHCKGFDSQKSMELFVQNYQPEIIH